MRNKHLILEFVKAGLTRPQAIDRIRKARKFKLKNRQIAKLVKTCNALKEFTLSATGLGRAMNRMSYVMRTVTEQFDWLAKEVLRQEAIQIDNKTQTL